VQPDIRKLKSIASGDVKFTGFVPDEELIKYYQKAKVYQLSKYEGLPNAFVRRCSVSVCPLE